MKIIISIALLMAGFLAPAAAESLSLYNLSVSLDISKNLISGNSTLTIPENGEINISTGNLKSHL